MNTPAPSVPQAVFSTLVSATNIAAASSILSGTPGRVDLVIDRDSLTGATHVLGYADGRLLARERVPFNPAEVRLHLHDLHSGPVSAERSHAWFEAVKEAAADAPEPVAEMLTERAHAYHRPHRCEGCGAVEPLSDAPRWSVALDKDWEITGVAAGDLTEGAKRAVLDADGFAFVINAHSIPSAYDRALTVLDDHLNGDPYIDDHYWVLSLTTPREEDR
ncbi:hypothetical protein [Kitasatospora purpeofusca]|uniref:hypothetical protein n=1 Tax=Kitasatospora purpeofusca TaxID=67352 RepID=UPI002A59902A|nr:hypothetical protein [Kitasatospora purpeofusca]MDY0811406.1 hypothetical protein [Kitasatospora purpeofusca]